MIKLILLIFMTTLFSSSHLWAQTECKGVHLEARERTVSKPKIKIHTFTKQSQDARQLVKAINKQIAEGIPRDQWLLSINGEITKTLDWLSLNADMLVQRSEFLRASFEKETIEKAIKIFKNNLTNAKSGTHIRYDEYFKLGVQFVKMASLDAKEYQYQVRHAERQSRNRYGTFDLRTVETVFREILNPESYPAKELEMDIALDKVPLLFAGELSVSNFNELMVQGVKPVGLVATKTDADGSTYTPHGFLRHDLDHNNYRPRRMTQWENVNPRSPSFTTRVRFYSRLMEWSQSLSPNEKVVVDSIFFSFYHEVYQYPAMDARNLLAMMKYVENNQDPYKGFTKSNVDLTLRLLLEENQVPLMSTMWTKLKEKLEEWESQP